MTSFYPHKSHKISPTLMFEETKTQKLKLAHGHRTLTKTQVNLDANAHAFNSQ